jgi:hypothetical protein
MATTTTSKLPLYWITQGPTMAHRYVYLLKAYSIPPTLVVNNDQIKVHLIPNKSEITWEPKATKHVQVLGLKDNRQGQWLFHLTLLETYFHHR